MSAGRRLRVRTRSCAALATAALLACAPTPPDRGAPPHALHAAALRDTMRALDRLRHGRLPQELDLEREQLREREAVARSARDMAQAAARIAPTAPLATLDRDDRVAFLELAAALRERAAKLAADAPTLSSDALATRLDDLDATCEGCHRLFRAPAARPGTRSP